MAEPEEDQPVEETSTEGASAQEEFDSDPITVAGNVERGRVQSLPIRGGG